MNESISRQWAERLQRVMPWGSGTCSKAASLFPEEPGVIVRGSGCRVWDADGKEYIDFRNSLGAVSLGYQFPAVDEAIREQLASGISFGHPHPLECEAAELFCELVPGAEQARFLKTGGEALAAAIRIARHYTGRAHIIQIGYNGWLNSLAAGGRVLPGRLTAGTHVLPGSPAAGRRGLPDQTESAVPGVPGEISALHHACDWNDIAGLERLFADYDIPLEVRGLAPCPMFVSLAEAHAGDPIVRFFKLAYQYGVSLYQVPYVNFSYRDEDLEQTLNKLENACRDMQLS